MFHLKHKVANLFKQHQVQRKRRWYARFKIKSTDGAQTILKQDIHWQSIHWSAVKKPNRYTFCGRNQYYIFMTLDKYCQTLMI